MRSKKKSIISPIQPSIITSYKSYWATHFYSVLKCLDSHKNLMHSPRKLNSFPLWSLCLLRGELQSNFFDQIEAYIQNWGVQYFLASFFNQKLSSNIIIELIDRLENLYDVRFSNSLDQFEFFVSGNDSSLSNDLHKMFSSVFPNNLNGERANTDRLIAYSDLCLILEDSYTQTKVGIFGEVEGIYGNKFNTEKYWGKKQDFCVFAIGFVDGSEKLVYFEESNYGGVHRVHLLFEKSNPIVTDFYNTLNYFKLLFSLGPRAKLHPIDNEFAYFQDKIQQSWSLPIPQLLEDLV